MEVLAQLPPFLVGSEPFPGLQDWKADAALFIRQNLGARCNGDPDAVALLRSIDELQREEWVSMLLQPESTAFLLGEPGPWTWLDLARALRQHRCNTVPANRIVEHPSLEMVQILKRSGKGSRRESCENANFLRVDSSEFEEYRGNIEQAIALTKAIAPGFAIEMESLVNGIAIADSQASFRGASGLTLRGVIMLSPDATWTAGIFAEELVHETTHTLLDLISIREPLMVGDEALSERWTAPFRPDKRPLIGNFHALVVICRLVHLFGRLRRSTVASELDWKARASEYISRAQEVLQTIERYSGLSPMARRLLDYLIKPTMALFPDQFERFYPAQE